DAREPLLVVVVGVRYVELAAARRHRIVGAEHPQLRAVIVVTRELGEEVAVGAVHRDDEVVVVEARAYELLRPVPRPVITRAAKCVPGALVDAITDVPVARARARKDDPVTESGLVDA